MVYSRVKEIEMVYKLARSIAEMHGPHVLSTPTSFTPRRSLVDLDHPRVMQ